MLIKLYIHPNKLTNLQNKESVLAKQMPNSQYEIEIFVDTKEYNVSFQEQGILLSKKSIFDKLGRR